MKSRRVVIVGGVAGGASCATRLRRLDETADIVLIERGTHVSLATCGMPYWIGGVIRDRDQLLVTDTQHLRDVFRIDARTGHEVLSIDRSVRSITVRELSSGREYTESYDALVLAPGAAPLRPPIPGIELPGIFTLRDLGDATRIAGWIADHPLRTAMVVGGGFIGLEMAENLVKRGYSVIVREAADQLLPPLDREMSVPVAQHLEAHGVSLRLGDAVARFDPGATGITVTSARGDRDDVALVVLAIGVRPETALARQARIELGPRGGIKVDLSMRTSDPAIYAVGDAVEVTDAVTGTATLVPLAGPANRQGRIAAAAIVGRPDTYRGTQGTAVVQVFDVTVAMTGASEKTLRRQGLPYEVAYTHPVSHAGYYPGAQKMLIKLLFAPLDGRILGAQIVGGEGVTRRVDVIAMALQLGGTIYDLEEAELCYAPQHGSAKDPVNMVGFVAGNHMRGDSPLVRWDRVDEARSPGGPLVLDVRSTKEQAAGDSLPDALNIPLPELRGRLNELPQDRPIWVHCRSGQRSHTATRILKQHGYDAYNLSGGTLLRAVLQAATPPPMMPAVTPGRPRDPVTHSTGAS